MTFMVTFKIKTFGMTELRRRFLDICLLIIIHNSTYEIWVLEDRIQNLGERSDFLLPTPNALYK